MALLIRKSELDLGGLLSAWRGLEVLALLEVEHARQERYGESFDLGIVLANDIIVDAPLVGNPVLGTGQLVLQPREIGARLQVGVSLGDRQKPRQSRGQLRVRLCRRGGRRRAGEAGSRLGDLLE